MSAQNTSLDSTANPSKDAPSSRGRDGRKATQDDSTDADANNPPNHGLPTHGTGQFLLWVGQRADREDGFTADLDDLPELWREWCDDSTQTDLTGWSE